MVGRQFFEHFGTRGLDRIHAQIERRAFLQRVDQRVRIVVLLLYLRKQPIRQFGLHRPRRLGEIDR